LGKAGVGAFCAWDVNQETPEPTPTSEPTHESTPEPTEPDSKTPAPNDTPKPEETQTPSSEETENPNDDTENPTSSPEETFTQPLVAEEDTETAEATEQGEITPSSEVQPRAGCGEGCDSTNNQGHISKIAAAIIALTALRRRRPKKSSRS
jgi:outer membrane biosynthesis protein TonB